MPNRLNARAGTWVLVGMALAGFVAMILATSKGVGLMPDSASYFSAAENLLAGNGLRVSGAGGTATPLVLWPPLYSVALAIGGLTGASLVEVARWLGALVFGAGVLMVGILVRHYTRSSIAALFGSVLALCSASLLETLSWGLSEGLFVVLYLLALLLLDRYTESRQVRFLFAAALTCGLACLARYSGIAIVMTGIVVLLWQRRIAVRRRMAEIGIFALFAAAPLTIWLIRNSMVSGSVTARPVVFHPVPGWKLVTALDTIASWFTTYRAAATFKWLVLGGIVLAVVILIIRRHLASRRKPDTNLPKAQATLLYPVAYIVTVIASISFLDAFIPMDNRLLSPLVPVIVILLVRLGFAAWQDAGKDRFLRVALGVTAGIWLCAWAFQAVSWFSRRSQDGAWYSSQEWRGSEIMAAVRALPKGTSIYSNVPEGIYFVAGRTASIVPSVVNHHTGRANLRYETQIDSLRALMSAGRAVLAHVAPEAQRRWYLPTERELAARLNLVPLATTRDGTIWSMPR